MASEIRALDEGGKVELVTGANGDLETYVTQAALRKTGSGPIICDSPVNRKAIPNADVSKWVQLASGVRACRRSWQGRQRVSDPGMR